MQSRLGILRVLSAIFWVSALSAQVPPRPESTESGPFWRHQIARNFERNGCKLLIDGKPFPASPAPPIITVETQNPLIAFDIDCSLANGLATSKLFGTVTMEGFAAEMPISHIFQSFYYRPTLPMPTSMAVTATLLPDRSRTPGSTYTPKLVVSHGHKEGGSLFGNCDTQIDEKVRQPKGSIQLSAKASCRNELVREGNSSAHGFGSPGNSNTAHFDTVVTITANENWVGENTSITDAGGAEFRIISEYKMSRGRMAVSPATLSLSADVGKTNARTGTIEITNDAGGYLDWYIGSSTATLLPTSGGTAGTVQLQFSPRFADTIAPRATSRITVNVDTSNVTRLATFSGRLVINTQNGITGATVPIEIVVGEAGGTDSVSLASVLPAAGGLGDQSEQRFSGIARYTLASANTGTVALELSDQAGNVFRRSDAVSLNRGTAEIGLSIPAFKLPAGLTQLSLKAVLRAGTQVTESAPVVYRIGQDRIFISYDSLRGAEKNFSAPWSGMELTRTDVSAGYNLTSAEQGIVTFRLTDADGRELKASAPQTVSKGSPPDGVHGEIPAFALPEIGSMLLTAVLSDAANGQELATSEPIKIQLVPPPQLRLEVGWRTAKGPFRWLESLPPGVRIVSPLPKGWPERPGGEGAPGLRVTWSSGEGQKTILLDTDSEEGPEREYQVRVFDELSLRPNELIYDVSKYWAPGTSIRAWMTNAQAQNLYSQPVPLNSERISGYTYTLPPETAVTGAAGQVFEGSGRYSTGSEPRKLVRYVFILRAGQQNYEISRTVVTESVQGRGMTFRDGFTHVLPADISSMTVEYHLEDDNPANKDALSQTVFSSFRSGPQALQAGVESTLAIPAGQLKATSSVPVDIQTGATASPLGAVGTGDTSGLKLTPNAARAAVKAPPRAAVQPEWIGIPRTWTFNPPIPANGTFTGEVVLNYTEADLPDDPNFDESKLRIVSFDPATGQTTALATVLNRENRTATASLDQLAPYYSLAVQGPFTKSLLYSPFADPSWTQNVALVNTGTADAESILSTFSNDGSLAEAEGVSNPAALTIARSAQVLTKPADHPAAGVQVSTGADVSSLALLTSGSRFEALNLSGSPLYLAILPDIVRTAGGSTVIHLANPTRFLNGVRATLWNQDGTAVGTADLPLEPKSRIVQAVESLFPALPANFNGYLTIQSDKGVLGAQFFPGAASTSALAAQVLRRPADSTVRLYAPYFSTGAILNLVNPTTLDAQVTISAYTQGGTAAGTAVSLNLAAGVQYRRSVAEIFGLSGTAAGQGSLRIESSLRGVVGNIALTSASVPLDLEPARYWLIPYFSNTGDVASTLLLQNSTGGPATAQVRMLRANGTFAGSAAAQLAANGSRADLLGTMISAAAGEQGYLLVEGDQPILPAVLLTRGTDTAAILPQPVPSSLFAPLPAPAIDVTPTALDFGSVTTGQTKELTLTVRNTGTAELQVTSVTSSNPRFAIAGLSSSFAVAAGASVNLTVRFSPTAAGAQTGTISLASNAGNRTVATTGTGAAPVQTGPPTISLTPTTFDFGSVPIGTTKTLPLTISNSGLGALNVTLAVSAPYSATPSTLTVAPGATATVQIGYTPTLTIVVTRTLTVSSNDPNRPSIELELVGVGNAGSTGQTVTLSVDDGIYELTVGFPAGTNSAYFVNRLTPPRYPATLRAVQVFFPAGELPIGTPITIVAAAHPAGTGGPQIGGLTFQSGSARIDTVEQMIEFTVNPITIQSGDFVVGFAAANPPSIFPAVLDISQPVAQRSYISSDGVTFRLIEGQGSGNLGIRARVQ